MLSNDIFITDEQKFSCESEEFDRTFECSIQKIIKRPNRHKLFEVMNSLLSVIYDIYLNMYFLRVGSFI